MSNNSTTDFGTNFKRFMRSKWGELTVLSVLSALGLLFTVIFYSIRFTPFAGTNRGEMSFWSADYFLYGKSGSEGTKYVSNLNIGFIVAFFAIVALIATAVAVMCAKKDGRFFYVASGGGIALCLVGLIVGIALDILRGGAIACGIVGIVIFMTVPTALVLYRRVLHVPTAAEGSADEKTPAPLDPAAYRTAKIALFVCACVQLLILVATFFVPIFTTGGVIRVTYSAVSALSKDAPVYISVAALIVIIAIFAQILAFTSTVAAFFRSDTAFVEQARRFTVGVTLITLFFFVLGFCLAFYSNLSGGDEIAFKRASTVSYIPLILATITLTASSVFYGKLQSTDKSAGGGRKPLKIEPLVYAVLITAVTFASLALNIVEIHAASGNVFSQDVKLSGYKLLSTYKDLAGGFRMLAFLEFAVLLVSGILLMLSVISFITKDGTHYRLVKSCAIANFVFVLLIGLFGIYFKMGQKINEETLKSLLDYYNISIPAESYTYEIKSQTLYMLIASFAVIAVMMIRGVFNLGAAAQVESADGAQASTGADGTAPSSAEERAGAADGAEPEAVDAVPDFDACPAFTEIDSHIEQIRADIEVRRRSLFDDPTLPELVRFVVDYARESRLHLSYSVEDMAAFVAGLGASRLAILQGMSGTGKTSLPKIFAEALLGNCEIVEVESSWRDKNELLGYYNEFSKCFTPKKFTQCLYKARLSMPVLTFIVLDEMNLSRIEYYFSDFLSLMENEEDKREIKLLNVKLRRTENGEVKPYAGLVDGHTIKIPANVWFIGTANRDESTFEISDKVYDRAQTMNFDKRAPKIHSFGRPLERRFVPYGMLVQLFNEAKSKYTFEAEDNELIQRTEQLLAPYNISFGNRVLKQIEDFVKIYCACFGERAAVENDAVERILLSKVVSKLENKVVENKEPLALEFDKLGLKKCAAFVRKLNED